MSHITIATRIAVLTIATRIAVLTLTTATLAAQTATPAPADYLSEKPTRAAHAMVVSIQHDASDAGLAILKQGGNAVDAAVAVGFALAVSYPQAGNIGGGGFMLIRDKSGNAHFLDYREMAPAAASANMYLDAKGNVVPGLSTKGYKASGVPGTVAGLTYAQKHYGKLTLAQDMAPAIALAKDGYILSDEEARAFASKNLTAYPESKRVFQRDGGKPYVAGDRFTQPDLAKTLERIAANPDEFYKGAMAKTIADHMQANGGLITAADLANYQCKEREPLLTKYHGYDVLTSPPPSSGGIVLTEILNILSGYDLTHIGGVPTGDRSPQQVQLITEAFRRAYMDRGDYLGDPDFTRMPLKEMANPAYAAAWRKTITLGKPSPSDTLIRPAGFMPDPPKIPLAPESHETTHFSVVDSEGNAVASTYTLNFGFGSGVTIPTLGFLMNDEMDDFTSKIGVPNGFHLIQGPANAIAPGKRPLSSMTPTIVSKNGKVVLVLGSPGGSTIITTVVNDIISVLDNGLNVEQAADAPRFHHQYLPDELQIEKKFPASIADQLSAMGYTIKRSGALDENSPGTWGDSEMIAVDPKTGELLGGHDTRKPFGKAAGY